MNLTLIVIASLLLLAVAAWWYRDSVRARQVPAAVRPGRALPEFHAVDENGDTMSSKMLLGTVAVLIFVRGTWCPFCSRQVANLTKFYKEITDSGVRLILITPKPLATTRRVADVFQVPFEFWLDESLQIAKSLGLLLESGVPNDHRQEYGVDTLWPTTLVVDTDGIIRHTQLSRFIADRPNPEKLLAIVRKI